MGRRKNAIQDAARMQSIMASFAGMEKGSFVFHGFGQVRPVVLGGNTLSRRLLRRCLCGGVVRGVYLAAG